MNRKELISKMSEFTQGTKVDCELHLDAFLKCLEHCVENNEKLNLVGYFSMELKPTPERVCRNPKKPEDEVVVPACNKVKFKAGKTLKELANE